MVDLYPWIAPDVVELFITWLQPLGRTSTARKPGDPLPFRTVRRVGGSDDGLTDHPLVAVHTIAATEAWAAGEGSRTYRRLRALAGRYVAPQPVEIGSGTAYLDDLECQSQDVVMWTPDRTEWAHVSVWIAPVRDSQPIHDDA